MHPIAYFLDTILVLYNTMVFTWVILQLLISFNILNYYNHIVKKVLFFLMRLVEPPLKIIRRYVPSTIGNVDISPLILLLLINFLRYTLGYYFH